MSDVKTVIDAMADEDVFGAGQLLGEAAAKDLLQEMSDIATGQNLGPRFRLVFMMGVVRGVLQVAAENEKLMRDVVSSRAKAEKRS